MATGFSDQSIRNGGTVDGYFTNEAGNLIEVRCTTANIPSAKSGYAVGCKLCATDTGVWYSNTGTTSSCTFTIASLVGTGSVGYFTVVKSTTGTGTEVSVFGSAGAPQALTITSVSVSSGDTIAATVYVANATATVATVTKSQTSGTVTAAATLSNTSVAKGASLTVSATESVADFVTIAFTVP